MAYPASAFTQQPQFITHRSVIQHHQQPQQQQQQVQQTHVAPTAILSTPPLQQHQQQHSQGQPTPPAVLAGHPPPPQVSPPHQASGSQDQQQLLSLQDQPTKVPYGAGGDDDGYTLVFSNLDEFQAWREKEEIEQCVDFVKGDVHGSRAMPPRFREHTKLVCARHVRSGRKKYIKKHPERQRKLPSRKLEGIGCNASISYKTYHDSDQVRASYNANHSHATGIENYPFTRRGRKQMANERGSHSGSRKKAKVGGMLDDGGGQGNVGGDDKAGSGSDNGGDRDMDMQMHGGGGGPDDEEEQVEHLTGITSQQPPPPPPQQPQQYAQQQQPAYHNPYAPQQPPPPPHHGLPPPSHPSSSTTAPSSSRPPRGFPKAGPSNTNGTGMALPPPPPPQPVMDNNPERWRWERLTTMFESIKANARAFDYPQASLAALEATLVRLTLESPLGPTGGG